ncbi:MAG: GH1 family beta-glucosidase [candidate division KSB1 bacterium]|nr:GH1 family beta-glucosidase [candidate division KSB1 bacterium]
MIIFPSNFTWGCATASYQIEGAWLEGGKGLSIWDAFSHIPGKILHGHTGDVACDHYHRYKEDVALMAAMGLPAYRFSISWPRIQPAGYGKPNPEGIRFYSDLIDELLKHNITPWVTLYHWDFPLALQLEFDGWLNPKIADFFVDYADICFSHFGDRVKNWITFNEPWVTAILGFGQGIFAPGRISNSEPYQAGHQMLRSHAKVVELYRTKYHYQNGRIGITNNCDWREPKTDSDEDRAAAQRSLEFFLGWFADPIYFGDYPEVMRQRLGERLPKFSPDEQRLIQGSNDFFGLNHYTTMYASNARTPQQPDLYQLNAGLANDSKVELSADSNWSKTAMGWPIVPWGCRKLLQWIDARYEHPEIVLTENGCAFDDHLVEGKVDDPQRIEFLAGYLRECHHAIQQGVNLTGYFLWSFMDNFEWTSGYTKRFGIHYIDFSTGQRIPKRSAHWYQQVIQNNGF